MKKILFIASIMICSCKSTQVITSSKLAAEGISVNGKIFTALYQQKAAEYRALCLQAFNIARLRLDTYKNTTNKPKAIITDIDETVLDNSPYAIQQGLLGKEYEAASWYDWTDRSVADSVPGAASFLKYAASTGIEIFYITNREERERTATLRNLQKFNLPNADSAHFLHKQKTSGKELRRQSVAATHEIIMLMGDNLADFSSLFDKKNTEERIQNTNMTAKDFGDRFIILPNPNYGDWEGALYNYNYKLTPAQKDSAIRSAVRNH